MTGAIDPPDAWSKAARVALESIPANLQPPVERTWVACFVAGGPCVRLLANDPDLLRALFAAWSLSEFVAGSCRQDPALLEELLDSGDLLASYGPQTVLAHARLQVYGAGNAEVLGGALRRLRRREMVRIAVRDLAGWCGLDETLIDLSLLAEACLEEAVRLLHIWTAYELGVPRGTDGQEQHLVVLGLGKLGAQELNFSSDIDLMLAFPERGSTDVATPVSNEEFFTRVGRSLVEAMSAITETGFVFRTDLRLRPFGESGPLVMSFDAMEDYYQTHAREWERYAMVKARPVAGDRVAGDRLMARLRPFVYRRYLDYGAFEALREMKVLITQQLKRKGMGDNIKLGAGGIREVEFVGQAFQLIRGGREPQLQERRILRVLDLLGERGDLPAQAAAELAAAYRFLRCAENRLQAQADQQTHVLPEAEVARLRLARAMGCADWRAFFEELQGHRDRVHRHFSNVIETPESADEASDAALRALWQGSVMGEEAVRTLAELGLRQCEDILGQLQGLRASHATRGLSRQGQARLDRLIPLVVRAVAGVDRPHETLRRVFDVVARVARRSAYLALLADRPQALEQLMRLSAASPWIVRLLARYPLLLDELLDARRLYAPLDRCGLEGELQALLETVDRGDLEQQMERLRQFTHSNVLRVAAADVTGVLPVMKVSDYLTVTAEVVLENVLRLAWRQLVDRYGVPQCLCAGQSRRAGFAIAAYGKLGGIELGYGSDLDLVFLHDSGGEAQRTLGERSVDNAVFFARLGQRIIHLLSTQTLSGVLYEVDVRLRPSGKAGLLVTSVEAFARYQTEQAWTWEHQALVRARVVAGDGGIARRFAQIRARVLALQRDPAKLCRAVVEMRERMRAELAPRDSAVFDLKHSVGGIADIEFMVQYEVLRWAFHHPDLVRYTDNIRILDELAGCGVMTAADRDLLKRAYQAYRAAVHQARLQDRPPRVAAAEWTELREAVRDVWDRWMRAD